MYCVIGNKNLHN
ncbi:UNVERIFIED_CONTAM: hypothetical protein GTU68_030590 [Idotea baltica]|nr:hypothetical protein [Idotea baltica]